MNKPRIFFDANSGNYNTGYYLCFDLSKRDLEKIGNIECGMEVVIYMTDELEFDAILKFDDDSGCWIGIPVRDSSGEVWGREIKGDGV